MDDLRAEPVLGPDGHTLADELHACAMDLGRVAVIFDRLIGALEAYGKPHAELEPANVIITPHVDHVDVRTGGGIAREPWAAPETLKDGALTLQSNSYSACMMLDAMIAHRSEAEAEAARRIIATCVNARPDLRTSLEDLRARVKSANLAIYGYAPGVWYPRFVAKDDHERALVELLRKMPEDLGTRAVYADWLEEHGELEPAMFLRRPEASPPASREHTSWRAIVALAPINSCAEAACPSSWQALRAIEGIENVRACAQCKRSINYCTSVETIKHQGRMIAPYVIDARLPYADATVAYSRGLRQVQQPGNSQRNALARFFGWFTKR